MKRILFYMLAYILCFNGLLHANTEITKRISIVGGGIIGALESYYAHKDAQENGETICVTIYEKGLSLDPSNVNGSLTNTAYNIAPSLTPDEILSVVPRGTELAAKLAIPFNLPGGIRVDDVPGVNESQAAIHFKNSVAVYGTDKNHDDRTRALLMLGKMSMNLWQEMYDTADAELKAILLASNFNPCHEVSDPTQKILHDGYRIDLIYGIPNAVNRAFAMKADYEQLGYQNCAILSPDEVSSIDPYLTNFCTAHSTVDTLGKRSWNNDCVALWRPGGCINIRSFLPRLYAYLKKTMGCYCSADGQMHPCFELCFDHEVTGVQFNSEGTCVTGLEFANGSTCIEMDEAVAHSYVFCPGESVGTLCQLGFEEPAYAAFAGPSLLVEIPVDQAQIDLYTGFSHCMEVHNEGIVLAWQAGFKNNHLLIGVAGTKAFYGDKQPKKEEVFATNRHLVQLNMINAVLPEMLSLACGRCTEGETLLQEDLFSLEAKGIAHRWVGRRAVAYDGFPTLGALYYNGQKISNARCTTHLGSGGVSFGPAAVCMSRCSERAEMDPFAEKILLYADSRRSVLQE